MIEIKSIKSEKARQGYIFKVELENKGEMMEATLTAAQLYSYKRCQQEILKQTGMMFRHRRFSHILPRYYNQELPEEIESLLNR